MRLMLKSVFSSMRMVFATLGLVPLMALCQEPSANRVEADRLYESGESSLRAGKYPEAESYFSSAIAKVGNDPRYYESRGSARTLQGNYKGALADYDVAIQLGTKTPYVFRNRGKVHFDLSRYDKALADYDQAINLKPLEVIAFRAERVAVYYHLQRMDEAAAEVAAVLESDPDNVMSLIYRGLIRHNNKEYEAARKDYDRALALDPKSASAYCNRATLNGEEGDYEKAVADFTRALEISGPDAQTLLARARCYYYLSKTAHALKDLSEGVALDPKHHDIHFDLASLLGENPTRLHEAYFHADEAVALAPHRSSFLRTRGWILFQLSSRERALRDLSAAIELDPKDALAYAYRAAATIDDVPEKARLDVIKALELDRECGLAFAIRGCDAVQCGKWADGIRDMERAIQLGRGDGNIYSHLSMAYGASPEDQVRNGEKALAYAHKVIEGGPASQRPGMIVLAVAYAEKRDFAKAIETAKKARDAAPSVEEKVFLDNMISGFEKGLPYRIATGSLKLK